jgi:hypothetical protein
VEYYFCPANLQRDTYLRSLMDAEGWVCLAEIAKFNRVSDLLSRAQRLREDEGEGEEAGRGKNKGKGRDRGPVDMMVEILRGSDQVQVEMGSTSGSTSSDDGGASNTRVLIRSAHAWERYL